MALKNEAALILEPNDLNILKSADRKNSISGELRVLLEKTLPDVQISRFLFKDSFPVDVRHNAKIKRDLLRAWAEKEI